MSPNSLSFKTGKSQNGKSQNGMSPNSLSCKTRKSQNGNSQNGISPYSLSCKTGKSQSGMIQNGMSPNSVSCKTRKSQNEMSPSSPSCKTGKSQNGMINIFISDPSMILSIPLCFDPSAVNVWIQCHQYFDPTAPMLRSNYFVAGLSALRSKQCAEFWPWVMLNCCDRLKFAHCQRPSEETELSPVTVWLG